MLKFAKLNVRGSSHPEKYYTKAFGVQKNKQIDDKKPENQ